MPNENKGLVKKIGGDQPKKIMNDYGEGVLLMVDITQVKSFEKNPRFIRAENYDKTKESIRKTGAKTITLSVTKRKNEEYYITYMGGGNRINILKELYKETNDSKYFHLKVIVFPYPGEAELSANHLAENIYSSLTFIETAKAILSLKVQMEIDLGKKISDTEFVSIANDSYPVSLVRQRLKYYKFAVELNEYCPKFLSSGAGRPAIESIYKVKSAFKSVCDSVNQSNATDDIFILALSDFKESINIDSDILLEKCVDYLASEYSDLDKKTLLSILNGSEDDINLKKKNEAKTKNLAKIITKFPLPIKDVLEEKNGKLKLNTPVDNNITDPAELTETQLTIQLLLPVIYKDIAERENYISSAEKKWGGFNYSNLMSIPKDRYVQILRIILSLQSNFKT